jgi:hypothetical protein
VRNEAIRSRVVEPPLNIYLHPMLPAFEVKDRTFVTSEDGYAIRVHEYSTYGRFLFTDFSGVSVTNNRFIHPDEAALDHFFAR